MYLKYTIAFILYLATCNCELCKIICLETSDHGCRQIEVVEVFEKKPPMFPTMNEMRCIIRTGGSGFNGRDLRCPQISTRPLPQVTSTSRSITINVNITNSHVYFNCKNETKMQNGL